MKPINQWDSSIAGWAPCRPIGCDNDFHLPGCVFGGAEDKTRLYRLAVPGSVIADPDSCLLCGWPERGHLQWYFGPHLGSDVPKTYVRPDDRTRLARMRERRRLRLRTTRPKETQGGSDA